MAKNNKAAKDSSATTITRVKAKDDKTSSPKKTAPQKATPVVVNGDQSEPKKKNFILRFLGYFKGAWYELRQVRWPNRRATIGMTTALLIFAGLFGLFIFVIDLAWENLFKLILG